MAVSHTENHGWFEIAICAAPELHDPLSAFFFDMGATGVVLEDFGSRTLKAYLPLEKSPEIIQDLVLTYLDHLSLLHPHLPPSSFRLSKLAHRDWHNNWRRFFGPVRISEHLMILPVWEKERQKAKERHVILIDPGPAFGTGQHATTKMCLRAMEFHVSAGEGAGETTFLDVGTGSGILAIYGAKLGFGQIEAVDLDPEAIRWARRNMRLNKVSEAIALSTQGVEGITKRFSLVCANLILNELLRLMPCFFRLVKKGGNLVASGILRDQVKKMAEALPASGFSIKETLYEEEWACMVLEKHGE